MWIHVKTETEFLNIKVYTDNVLLFTFNYVIEIMLHFFLFLSFSNWTSKLEL